MACRTELLTIGKAARTLSHLRGHRRPATALSIRTSATAANRGQNPTGTAGAHCGVCHASSTSCLHASSSRHVAATAAQSRLFSSSTALAAQPLPSRIDEDWGEYDFGTPTSGPAPSPASQPSPRDRSNGVGSSRHTQKFEPFKPPPAPTAYVASAAAVEENEDIDWDDYMDPPRNTRIGTGADSAPGKTAIAALALQPQVDPDFPPPLPAGEMLSDEQARYDWRARAPSQTRRKRAPRSRARSWFPDMKARRGDPPLAKLSQGEPYFEEVQNYFKQFEALLQAEHEEERRMHLQRQLEWADERLRREGYMLDELVGEFVKAGDYGSIYTFAYGGKRATERFPFHQFAAGGAVELSRTHPQTDAVLSNGKVKGSGGDGPLLKGSVSSVGKGWIRVVVPTEIHDIGVGEWRLDEGLNDFALQKQIRAMTSLHLDPTDQELLDSPRKRATPLNDQSGAPVASADEYAAVRDPLPEQMKLLGTHLRDKILRAFQRPYRPRTPDGSLQPTAAQTAESLVTQPTDLDAVPVPSEPEPDVRAETVLSRNQVIKSWTERYRVTGQPLRIEGDPEIGLNPSQMRAIAMMLSERLSLVQGPPGTGKTRVIIETIKLLKRHWQVPHPVLVTAHTNAAVDNLVAGLAQNGLKAVRYGPPERIREDLADHGFEAACARHPLFRDIERMREKLDDRLAELKVGGLSTEEQAKLLEKTRWLRGKIWYKQKVMAREVLLDADVVCTTCLSATSRALDEIDFPIVFLDEASMATEPLSLIPLTKGSAHVAIIGDHKQLPPVIISPEAHAGGLAVSLFERLIHEHHIPSIMLDTQYRMHPLISSFPSSTFYHSLLADGTVDSDGNALPRFDPPKTDFLLPGADGRRMNVSFVDHDHPESPTNKSIANWGDAEKVCDVVADLLHWNPDLKGKDIGVITPYTAQIRLIKHYLLSDQQRIDAFAKFLGPERAAELDDIEVKTVDGFEGREKEVVIFSTTRSNSHGFIGFLADWRRVNVGLTRAKRGLILIGSASTLGNARSTKAVRESLPPGGEKVWRDYIAWLRAKGLIIRA